jgi:hypothetical protein
MRYIHMEEFREGISEGEIPGTEKVGKDRRNR